ncbi:MAG: hypothetical protein AAB446_01830 [Patescibacteria group bacterium]
MSKLKLLMLFMLVFSPLKIYSQNNDKGGYPTGFGLEFRFTTDFATGKNLEQYYNIPAEARTIPIHKDDGWLGTPGTPVTLSDSTLEASASSYNFGLSVAGQYSFASRMIIRGGAQFNTFSRSMKGPTQGMSDNTVSESINGYGREEGSSIMYYSLGSKFSRTISPFGELELRIGERSGFLIGFAKRQRAIYVQNGYDRYNSLETYSFHTIDKKSYNLPYVGFKVGLGHGTGVLFNVGYELHRNKIDVPDFLKEFVEKPQVWDMTFGLYYVLSKTKH